MTVLVLGASSHIGSAIAEAFASKNELILSARNAAALASVEQRCLAMGATNVRCLSSDLRLHVDQLLTALSDTAVDVVINVASATSQQRDDEMDLAALKDYVSVDVTAPVELIRQLLAARGARPLRVIYISTILAVLKSPNRIIYGSLKAIQEKCLRVLTQSASNMQLLVVRVATPIPSEKRTIAADRLAASILQAFNARRTDITFGTTGRALHALYYIQPLVFEGIMSLYRSLSRRQVVPKPALPRPSLGPRE